MVRNPFTRAEARLQGNKFFETGLPCINGHRSLRRTSNGNCVACSKSRGKIQTALWRKSNREKDLARKKAWSKLNKEKVNASNSSRHKRVKQATPKWADLQLIKQFYLNRPKGYHVDHYYPINSNWVCGLHVIENLQYLSDIDNMKKGNRKLRGTF